jgi:hypothetical protein
MELSNRQRTGGDATLKALAYLDEDEDDLKHAP